MRFSRLRTGHAPLVPLLGFRGVLLRTVCVASCVAVAGACGLGVDWPSRCYARFTSIGWYKLSSMALCAPLCLQPSCCTACILRTQRPGYSPKNTCHLSGSTAKQQSPHENNETAFNLVLHCPYEQLRLVEYNYEGACKMHTCSSGKCHTWIYHQDAQLATNTIIIFLLLNGCLLLCPHRLRHMRPRSIHTWH